MGMKLVERFVENDYKVVFQYHTNDDKANDLSQRTEAMKWQADFSNDFELPDRDFDIVINNAGILLTKTYTADVTDEEWEKTLQVNLTAPFKIIKKYLPSMVSSSWGRIINIGSIYSLRGTENNSSYNVSKHGLSGLTKTVAKEYASEGITCNEICPAAIESDTMDRIARQKEEEQDISATEFLNQVREANPSGRMVFPEDVASVALFLASPKAEFINGESIVVDGAQIC